MKHRVISILVRLVVTAALTGLASAALPAPAGAALSGGVSAMPAPGGVTEERPVAVQGLADCDQVSGEWLVRWHITNPYPVVAEIDRVSFTPEATKARDMPTTVPANSTVVTGGQRLPPGVTSGSITLHLTWADGAQGSTWWPVYIFAWCAASA